MAMPKNLLIVESPAKAKTIEKYLGSDFTVKSSYGHVRDLEKGPKAVDVDNHFSPKYVISPEKNKVVKELRDWVKKVDEVWLATDEDREGEAISWHLCEVLGLNPITTKRIVFREITKPAIEKAVQRPRALDLNLVNAQQARRVLDRLVGFELSEILWKKIRGGLSAGRVQSVAVKLIVEKEREIQQFKSQAFFRIEAQFNVHNEQGKPVVLKAESPLKFNVERDAETFLRRCTGAAFPIGKIEVRPQKRRPAAPFTTSTLQQEASRKFGFSVQRTMNVAQGLYEAGHITYMRTDSTNLSETAIAAIAQSIEQTYGAKYVEVRRFKSKSANAQEAHEAIRPTYIQVQNISGNRDEQRLYELIWKRTIASQMADAELEKTVVTIGISTIPDATLVAEGEVLKFDGFLKVYLESNDDEEEEETKGMLPPLKTGQILPLREMTATERFTRPPARYTEAGLVKKLEELGIGRPSTYAPTISKIMEDARGYVVKESRPGIHRPYQILCLQNGQITKTQGSEIVGAVQNRLFPTDMGATVSDFLDTHFEQIMDYQFTAGIEKVFDDIAAGEKEWTTMLGDFYWPFHREVEATIESAVRPTRERILGKDPSSGLTLITRMTRLGPVVQIGVPEELGEEGKPRYANLRNGQSIETISFEEALKLFELPKVLGTYQEQEVGVGVGKYGPYVRLGEKFIALPRGEDPLTVNLDRAIAIIQDKEKGDAPVGTFQGKPITKGKGRFGPFLKWNDIFINVPAKYDFNHLTQGQMETLITDKLNKEANRYVAHWQEEQIAIENGRWGPFIRFKKESIPFPKTNGERMTPEQAAQLSLEAVKALIVEKIPDAFQKPAAKKKKVKQQSVSKK
jgi:DNA topoisomerase-1